tara:strand:+ start:602 stop:853 length:252 start_codon:yes stop_codon:yes gene_type:complete
MAYYTIANTGKGFITHADNESAHVAGYPGDVWVTENSTWATRVGATSKTKAEAQLLVDTAVSGTYYDEGPLSGSAVSGTIVLP